MKKIHIDNKPFATDYWFSGTYTIDVGDDSEYREETYEFTIQDSEQENLESNGLSITWTEAVPKNSEEVEKKILENYQQR